ncbi:MAG: PAS domain S-box protein [Bacteroidota bacterium]
MEDLILVAGDAEADLVTLTNQLAPFRYTVREYAFSNETTDAAAAILVLTPGNAFTALPCSEKTCHLQAPIVVITGSTDPAHHLRALEAGATEVVAGSYTGEQLHATIQRAIKRHAITASKARAYADRIKEQEEQLDNLLFSIKDAIWARKADTHELIYVNNAYNELFGYTDGFMPGKDDVLEAIHPDDREAFAQAIHTVGTTGTTQVVYRHQLRDGNMKILKVHATLKKGTEGKPDTINGITLDITKEKELQDEIRRSEQKLLATINNTRDLIWSVDTNLRLIFCNKAYHQFFYKAKGIDLKEGDSVLGEWQTPSFLTKRHEDYQRSLNGESFITVVEEFHEGTTLYFEISSSPIMDHDGQVIGVNCVSRDITNQELQLMKIRDQNDRLREIAWIQSHKVRGPVASILGLIALLPEDTNCEEQVVEILDRLRIATDNLDNVIKEVVNHTHSVDYC